MFPLERRELRDPQDIKKTRHHWEKRADFVCCRHLPFLLPTTYPLEVGERRPEVVDLLPRERVDPPLQRASARSTLLQPKNTTTPVVGRGQVKG